VSTRARMDALELQVTNLGAFQAGVRTTFDEVDRRISRHRRELKALAQEDEEMQRKFDVNTGVLCDSLSAVEAKIESMVDKLCHCSAPSPLSGQGTSDSPYELEYADEDAPTVVPLENKTPLPVAGPSSVLLKTRMLKMFRPSVGMPFDSSRVSRKGTDTSGCRRGPWTS
jgi:hypothetical protein